jgi:replicative DNA helicase
MAKEIISALPYNLEAEQSLLGSIMIDKELQYEIRANLKVEDFYLESHKLVFEGICSVLDDNKPVDVVTLADEMGKTPLSNVNRRRVDIAKLAEEMEKKTTLERAGGIGYLTELSRATPSASNYEYYLNIVKRDSILRKLIRASESIILEAKVSTNSNNSVAFAEKSIYSISEDLDISSLSNIKEDFGGVLDLFKNIQEDAKYMQGLHTGFTGYDRLTNGLHKGNLIIIAARPSVGKSTFAMNIVEHVALKRDAVCAVFALEMTKAELAERMACSISGVSSELARRGKLSNSDWSSLWNAQKLIEKTNIYIDDTSMTTVPEILSKCRRLKAMKGKLDLIVVDHIQLMNAVKSSENRQAEITEISRGLKMIAKELDVPVIALSQLSRAVEKNNRKPILSDLRESGSIEQDADVVMFIHRPEMTPDGKSEGEEQVKKDEAEMIIEKNRSGSRGSFKLVFKGEKSKFVNIAYNEPSEPIPYSNSNENGFKKFEPEDFGYTPNDSDIPPIDDNDIPY